MMNVGEDFMSMIVLIDPHQDIGVDQGIMIDIVICIIWRIPQIIHVIAILWAYESHLKVI
jgi:hypothetical protein